MSHAPTKLSCALTKQQIAEALLSIGAVSVSPTSPFPYKSGLMSPIYTNCRTLAFHPKERDMVATAIADLVRHCGHEESVVVSAGTASIFLASLVSDRLGIPMVFVRDKPKSHGMKKEVEGILKPGSKVALVTDIFSTEDDVMRAVDVLKRNGANVAHCLSVFTNNIGTVESFLAAEKIPYDCLTDLAVLLDTAYHQGRLSQRERTAIEEWMRDREGWASRRAEAREREIHRRELEIAESLLRSGVVRVNVCDPFRLHSGLKSPIYADNRLLISQPDSWSRVIDSFVFVLTEVIGLENFDVLAGTAMSGIPHATLIADRIGVPLTYVRFEESSKGEKATIEGRLERGDRVVMIEDHVTTGQSVLAAAHKLRESGATVDWCVAIFTFDLDKVRSTFRKEHINLVTLSDLTVLLDVAIREHYMTPDDKEAVLQWLADPEHWQSTGTRTQKELHEIKSS